MHHILIVDIDQCKEDPTGKDDNLVKSYSTKRHIEVLERVFRSGRSYEKRKREFVSRDDYTREFDLDPDRLERV